MNVHFLRDILTLFQQELSADRGFTEGEAARLLADLLNLPRTSLSLSLERVLTEEEKELCFEALLRRKEHEPSQYICEETVFYHSTFKVSPAVLIPRPETEQLVDFIVQRWKEKPAEEKKVWDLCCGSGCIGISLKEQFPLWQLTLADLSIPAIEIAEQNREKYALALKIVQGDFLDPFIGQQADLIVCNPPYVTEKEWQQLDPEVRDYEPKEALVAKEKGMEFYQRLALVLDEVLAPKGELWLEIGASQGKEIHTLFSQQGWENGQVKQDYSGRDRFFFLERES